jgi:uncharacterized protein YyaL (SSP411 family)
VTEEGNFEGANIPHVAVPIDEVAKLAARTPEAARAAVARARELLYAARLRRVPPLRDEKILAAWNGLMISAIAEAGRILATPRYVEAAVAAADFVWRELRRDGRLLHVWARGAAKQPAFLDDHAFLAAACLDLYEATADARHLARAAELAVALEGRFRDDRGGYFFTADDAERLIARSKSGADGALPSGNAVAALVHLRLHALTDAPLHRERAEELLRLYHSGAAEQPFAYATYLEALEWWVSTPTEVVIVAGRDDPAAAALWDVVARTYLPHRVLVRVEPGAKELPAPARDRPEREGRATAYVCRNFACAAPVHEPAALAALLEPATRP